MIKIMQADSFDDLKNNFGRGDAGDPYPGIALRILSDQANIR